MAITLILPYFPGETGVSAIRYSEDREFIESEIALTETDQPGMYSGSIAFDGPSYQSVQIYSDGADEPYGFWAIAVAADNTTADYAESIGELRSRAAIMAAGVGTGARTVTITVTDGTNPLASALVRVTSGVNSFTSLTNNSGVVVFNLDDGTWTVAITKSGYSYAGSSITVDGNETATLAMTAISFPSSPTGQVTGYWYVYTSAGAVDAGTIVNISTANAPRTSTGLVLQDDNRQVTANGSGLLTVSGLFPGVTYKVYRQGSSREFIITVPVNAVSPVALGSIVG